MLHRVIYNADDSVMIMSPNSEVRLKGETEAEQLERFYQKYLLSHPQHSGLSHEDMDTTALPSDRANRAKWRKKPGGGVMIDDTVVLPQTKADKLVELENRVIELEKPVAAIP